MNLGNEMRFEEPRGIMVAIARTFLHGPLSLMFLVAAMVMGIVALLATPQEEEPQIVVPMVDVYVQVPGREPAEVEEQVTRPLERILWQIPGVEHVYSVSRRDQAIVTVRFYVGEDREESILKVRDQIESHKDIAPQTVAGWIIKPMQIDDVPIVQLTFFSTNRSAFEVRRVAEEVKARMEGLQNIFRSEIIGGNAREIIVEPDKEAMAARGVSMLDIMRALQGSEPGGDAGELVQDGRLWTVRVHARLRTAADVGETVLRSAEGRTVRISDVAEVRDGPEEPTTYHHIGFGPAEQAWKALRGTRLPAVTLAFAKKKGSNAITVAKQVIARAEQLRGTVIPADVDFRVTRNYGATAREKVNGLLSNMFFAIVTVVSLIAVTMGWREGLVVGLSVPVSFALALFVNYMAGYTINRVTLFALILSLGLVVDDPITNVDNIQRHIRIGLRPPLQATLWAIKEMVGPVVMSTLTIIVSFTPMFFITGMMGPYMGPMAINVPLTVSFSTVCATTFVPWLAYRLLRHRAGTGEATDVTPEWIRRGYARVLSPFLNIRGSRILFISMGLALIGCGLIVLFRLVPLKMLPFDNKNELQLVIDLPDGSTLEQTDALCQELEAYLATVNEVRDYESYVGVNSPIDFNGLVRHYNLRRQPHLADIRINLVGKTKRKHQSHAIALRIRDDVTRIAARHGALVRVVEVPPGPPVLSTLTAEVYGDEHSSYADIIHGAKVLQERMRAVDSRHIAEIDDMTETPREYLALVVDDEKAARHGLTAAEVSMMVHAAMQGPVPVLLHAEHEREPLRVRVRLPYADRVQAARLEQLWLPTRDGRQVQLAEIARFEPRAVEQPIYHKDLERVMFVTAECVGRPPGEIVLAMYHKLRKEPLPRGISVKWASEGEWQITVDVFRDLGIAFGVALIGIYLLLVLQTGSWALPIVMMLAIPLTAIGIMPGFWLLNLIAGETIGGYASPVFFTATAMIGMIALGGIVIRNSVVLIEFVQQAVREGMNLRDALLSSGAVRFRPIMLTATTTLLGVWPITLDPIFSGLAWSLIFGLLASTAFTMVVIPTVYYRLNAGREAAVRAGVEI